MNGSAWRWQLGTLGLLLPLAGLPLLAPLVELATIPSAWQVFHEADRLKELAATSILYCGLVVLAAVPLGTLVGFLLSRTDLPARGVGFFLLLLTLLLPVPLAAAGWHMLAVELGWPWPQAPFARLLTAAGIQALFALPWVALITGMGFRWVEPELEEESLLTTGPWRVVWHVTLPRVRPAVWLAAFWVALLAWQDITLTDYLRLRTFGEEVYLQFNSGGAEFARAMAASLPVLALAVAVAVAAVRHFQRLTPPAERQRGDVYRFPLGPWRWPALGLVFMVTALMLGGPIAGLTWKAGLIYATAAAPGPATWHAVLVPQRILGQLAARPEMFAGSAALAVAVGLAASLTALWLHCVGRFARTVAASTSVAQAWLLALPGPILGVGVLTTITWLLMVPGLGWLGDWLYYRPSPLPVFWVQLLRFLPVAWLMLWPACQWQPLVYEEEIILNGGGMRERFWHVYLRPLVGSWLAVAAAVATLAVGEISASKMVATPGHTPLAHHLFLLMHASADAELAAVGLALLLLVLMGGGMLAGGFWLRRRGRGLI